MRLQGRSPRPLAYPRTALFSVGLSRGGSAQAGAQPAQRHRMSPAGMFATAAALHVLLWVCWFGLGCLFGFFGWLGFVCGLFCFCFVFSCSKRVLGLRRFPEAAPPVNSAEMRLKAPLSLGGHGFFFCRELPALGEGRERVAFVI